MSKRILGCTLGGLALCLLLTSCEQLRLPPAALAAAADGGEAGPSATPTLIPAGAVIGGSQVVEGGECSVWATTNTDGTLKELSFSLPLTTISNIPETAQELTFYIKLPDIVLEKTLFKSMAYSIFPHGHVPAGVYDIPHWEWHLEALTEEEYKSLDCSDPTHPPPDMLPPNWFFLPVCVATGGGFHAFDRAAPEYNSQRYTKGVSVSYYHGVFGGLEPGITAELLKQRKSIPADHVTLPRFGKSGLWPKNFVIDYRDDFDAYVFTYSDWVQVQ